MPTHEVTLIDKRTGKPVTFAVTGNHATPEEAAAHVAGLPGSHGGTHPGFKLPEAAPEVTEPAPTR